MLISHLDMYSYIEPQIKYHAIVLLTVPAMKTCISITEFTKISRPKSSFRRACLVGKTYSVGKNKNYLPVLHEKSCTVSRLATVTYLFLFYFRSILRFDGTF